MKNIYETPKSDLRSGSSRHLDSVRLWFIVLAGIIADILLNNLYWKAVSIIFHDVPETEAVTLTFNLASGVVDFVVGAAVAIIATRHEIAAALGVSICALIYSLVNSGSDHDFAFAMRLTYYFSMPVLAGLMVIRLRTK